MITQGSLSNRTPAVMERFYLCAARNRGHGPHVAIEHLKRGCCTEELSFTLYLTLLH